MYLDEMTADKLTADKLIVDKMNVDMMTVDKKIVDKMTCYHIEAFRPIKMSEKFRIFLELRQG